MLLILQKTLKSIQLHQHQFFERLGGALSLAATPGAWTQARAKLRHSAFVELNEAAVLAPLEVVPETLARWQGLHEYGAHRVPVGAMILDAKYCEMCGCNFLRRARSRDR